MAAVWTKSSVPVSGPYPMAPATTSRTHQPSTSSTISTPDTASSKPFNRLRSSLEQTLRSATRSKKTGDDFSTVTPNSSKGKEKANSNGLDLPKEKSPGMLRRLESKVNFRRNGRESITPSASPIPPMPKSPKKEKERMAGFTSFITPSLRQGTMSSPALHLYSQALPSPRSQPSVPASSSSNNPGLVSPPRERTRRVSLQPPAPGTPKRDVTVNGRISSTPSKHRPSKSQPINIPSAPSSRDLSSISPPSTPTGRESSDWPSPPPTPTPKSGSRGQLVRASSKASSSSHLPLGTPPSPITPRNSSPIRPRSPSTRTRVTVTRGLSSSSTSNLPLSSSNHSAGGRRPSVDSRPSIDSPRRSSIDIQRRGSSSVSRDESPPPPKPRPTSPHRPSYMANRHINMSSASLVSPPNPEHRELIRTATTMLCKEIKTPHATRAGVGIREWEEVEVRTQSLVRLERMWTKSGFSTSSTNVNNPGGSGISAGGEERERRLFCEALRDGFVLCMLMNKLRSSSIVKPDPREDGVIRTANVTRFLAACASYGLPNEDLFHRDDLIEATGESLARVAKTVIALIKFVDAPTPERSRYRSGSKPPASPYSQTSRSGSSSSPNLLLQSRSSPSPTPTSPVRKRTNPSPRPPESVQPDHSTVEKLQHKEIQEIDHVGDSDRAVKDVPKIMPPPRSPLRSRSSQKTPTANDDQSLFTWAVNPSPSKPPRSSVADSTRASVGDASVRDSIQESNLRQSVASVATNTTATTQTTMFSSLLEVGRSTTSGVFNKFGTIRTVTTEATSESPSITRTEGSSIADDLNRRKGFAESAVDLSRVVEETEDTNSAASSQRHDKGRRQTPEPAAKEPERQEKVVPAIRLGKGKWPDDFIGAGALQPSGQSTPTSSMADLDDRPPPSPLSSTSGPRKLAIVGATRRNESLESLPQFPRRPSHRARHSLDTPALLPRETVRRENSPDGLPTAASRVIVRRSSSKPSPTSRSGVYLSRPDDPRGSSGESDAPIPFPRTASGEHFPLSSSPRSSTGDDLTELDKARPPRGRFQSDIQGSRRRPRPSSYDELGARPQRTRFESMVNLGASSNASASDIMSRDSLDGSAVRKTLIIKDEGKAPTHFQLGNCIGRGQFGSVYRALNLNTGQMVAVKRIRLDGLKEDEVTTLMREVDLVKSLSHPSIVKYEGMARDDDTLSIVLEYAENGSLGQTLKAFGKLNERLVASYVVKILEGLHYLHRCDVVHCDLKAANILTTKNGNVKLSDFGVSLNMRAVERDIKDVAGTPNWMAPEVIELKGASPKSDIWSLGCTVIELLTGKPPYAEIANSMSVMFRIVEDKNPPIPEGCSSLLVEFLSQCFHKEPADRPTAEMLCEHQWLKKNWAGHKELRPQDSIPFLRRVSADLQQKSDAVRFLSQLDLPESPTQAETPRPEDFVSGSPPRSAGIQRPGDNEPRGHSFVKTTFSKPMICRVCLLNVKKSAVLCAQCSLISHSKCAVNAPPTCDLRAQLLLYAQYAEKGNPGSVYSNPVEFRSDLYPKSPMSDVSYVAHTPRTSLDLPRPPASPLPPVTVHPPTAFKLGFKKRGSTPTPETELPLSSSPPKNEKSKRIGGRRLSKERPPSLTSNSTNTTSVRSTSTTGGAAPESAGRKSMVSANGVAEGSRAGKKTMSAASEVSESPADERSQWQIPGDLAAAEHRRHKKTKSSGNCIVQ